MVTATRKDDRELVALAATGDQASQGLLVERLRRRVGTVALAILGNPHDAEDAAQAILLEILRSAANFRGENLLAWSDRIAVRIAMRQARERRVRSARQAEDDVEAVGTTDPTWFGSRAIPRPIQEYLAELPEARRTALVLRHVMDYSIDEIAELTGVSTNTVKDRLLQGRDQMRRRIRQDLFVTSARTGSKS